MGWDVGCACVYYYFLSSCFFFSLDVRQLVVIVLVLVLVALFVLREAVLRDLVDANDWLRNERIMLK